MNFLTSLSLGSSNIRSFLKIAGTAATCVGMFNPAIGAALAGVLTAVGPAAAAVGVLASIFAHKGKSA